jgi:hypothetical protein
MIYEKQAFLVDCKYKADGYKGTGNRSKSRMISFVFYKN